MEGASAPDDGGKLLASARVLLAKYANEPEPQPPQPAEQKVVTEPRQRPQANAEVPKGDTPATTPIAKPAPAAATPRKELDIPL